METPNSVRLFELHCTKTRSLFFHHSPFLGLVPCVCRVVVGIVLRSIEVLFVFSIYDVKAIHLRIVPVQEPVVRFVLSVLHSTLGVASVMTYLPAHVAGI
jgi:hypothetical protein